MLFLWLVTTAMVAAPVLHELVHKDAKNPGHECAVTAVQHGKFSFDGPVTVSAVPVQAVETASANFVSILLPAIPHRLASGRAPPTA